LRTVSKVDFYVVLKFDVPQKVLPEAFFLVPLTSKWVPKVFKMFSKTFQEKQ
jgi:hypothetical protein